MFCVLYGYRLIWLLYTMKRFRWHKTGGCYTLQGSDDLGFVRVGEAGFTATFDGRTKVFGELYLAFSWVESLV